MPAIGCSILAGDCVVIRLRRPVYLSGRLLLPHGVYGGLHALDARKALRLVDTGQAKLPGQTSLRQLREHCAGLVVEDGRQAAA